MAAIRRAPAQQQGGSAELYSDVGTISAPWLPQSLTQSRNYQISLLICIQSGLRHVVTIHVTWKLCDWDLSSQAPSLLRSSRAQVPGALLTADPTPDTSLQMCAEFLQVMLPLAVRVPQRRREGTPGRRRHKIVTKILLRLYLLSPWHSSTPRHRSIPPGEVYSNDTLELRGTGGLFIYIRYISRMRWRDVVSM